MNEPAAERFLETAGEQIVLYHHGRLGSWIGALPLVLVVAAIASALFVEHDVTLSDGSPALRWLSTYWLEIATVLGALGAWAAIGVSKRARTTFDVTRRRAVLASGVEVEVAALSVSGDNRITRHGGAVRVSTLVLEPTVGAPVVVAQLERASAEALRDHLLRALRIPPRDAS